MAQHDFNIENASFPTVRADINNVLTAINTTQLGASAPSTAAQGTLWIDSANSVSAEIISCASFELDIIPSVISDAPKGLSAGFCPI